MRCGYTAGEMRAKAAADSLIGVSKWELDTPALCVDLDKMDQNLATMRTKLAASGVASRPHAKTHKCPAIAKLQLAAGSIGVCTAKVSEAEALYANGVEKILMTTSNVTREQDPPRDEDPQGEQVVHPGGRQPAATRRICPMPRRKPASSPTSSIDVAVGTRSGVPADERALALAQLVDKLPNLKLRGMISYDGSAQHIKGFRKRLRGHAASGSSRRSAPSMR